MKKHIENLNNLELITNNLVAEFNEIMRLALKTQYATRPVERTHIDKESCFSIFGFAAEALRLGEGWDAKPIAIEFLKKANSIANVQYLLVCNPSQTVNFELFSEKFETVAPEFCNFTTVDYWYRDLAVALVLRNNDSIKQILCYQAENTRGRNDEEPDTYDAALCAFLKGVFDSKADIKSLFTSLMEATVNHKKLGSRQRYIDLCITPTILVWASLIEKDWDKFEANVKKASEGIFNYYKSSKELKFTKEGWFPFLLIAACALAYDEHGYELQHDNPYVPEWLVNGEFS